VRTIEQREWLVFLEAELARRAARVEWQANEGERSREWFVDTLQQMAQRFAAPSLYPLDITDMSPAELLSCHLLPEHLQPPGLPTEAAIWAKFRVRET
jgi:hypothetical protein